MTPRNSTTSQVVHEDVDASLLTFDHALSVATIDRRSVGEMLTDIHHTHQQYKVDDENMGRIWGVSTEVAARTRKVTTQRGLWYLKGNLDRRFKTRLTQLRRPLMYTKVYADTMVSSQKSIRGNTCAEILITSEGLVNGLALKSKGDAYLAFEKSCKEDGIPNLLVTDMARE